MSLQRRNIILAALLLLISQIRICRGDNTAPAIPPSQLVKRLVARDLQLDNAMLQAHTMANRKIRFPVHKYPHLAHLAEGITVPKSIDYKSLNTMYVRGGIVSIDQEVVWTSLEKGSPFGIGNVRASNASGTVDRMTNPHGQSVLHQGPDPGVTAGLWTKRIELETSLGLGFASRMRDTTVSVTPEGLFELRGVFEMTPSETYNAVVLVDQDFIARQADLATAPEGKRGRIIHVDTSGKECVGSLCVAKSGHYQAALVTPIPPEDRKPGGPATTLETLEDEFTIEFVNLKLDLPDAEFQSGVTLPVTPQTTYSGPWKDRRPKELRQQRNPQTSDILILNAMALVFLAIVMVVFARRKKRT